MNNSLVLGFAFFAAVMLFTVIATTPAINSVNTGIPHVLASEGNSDKECLSASSALYFDTQSALTASA